MKIFVAFNCPKDTQISSKEAGVITGNAPHYKMRNIIFT